MRPPKVFDIGNWAQGVGEHQPPVPTQITLFHQVTRANLQEGSRLTPSHHRCVLIFNLNTKGNVHINSRVLPFSPGQGMAVLPFQFHHYSHLAAEKLRWLFCTFELEDVSYLEPLKYRVLDLSPSTMKMRDAALSEWERLYDPEAHLLLQSEQLQATVLRLIAGMKIDLLSSAPPKPSDATNDLLNRVNRALFDWQDKRFSIPHLAEKLDMSTSQLRVLFKQAAGIALGGYIRTFRINRAMNLLHKPHLTIAEIAEESGFSSSQAFSRAFKKAIGKSPRAFRVGK